MSICGHMERESLLSGEGKAENQAAQQADGEDWKTFSHSAIGVSGSGYVEETAGAWPAALSDRYEECFYHAGKSTLSIKMSWGSWGTSGTICHEWQTPIRNAVGILASSRS